MPATTDEEWKALKELILRGEKWRIECMILSTILFKSQVHQVPVKNWQAELKAMRDLPLYRNALLELETLLAEVESKRQDSKLRWLLEHLPKPTDLVQ